jgi:nuclear pore complex protein Nup133
VQQADSEAIILEPLSYLFVHYMMFSTNTPSHSAVASLRNPRRRQRTTSDESVKFPRAKRQRSTLRQSSDETPGGRRFADELSHGESSETQVSSKISPDNGLILNEIALRGPRKPEKRGARVDGTIFLVGSFLFEFDPERILRADWNNMQSNNDHYMVSHLLPLPDHIRENPTGDHRQSLLVWKLR